MYVCIYVRVQVTSSSTEIQAILCDSLASIVSEWFLLRLYRSNKNNPMTRNSFRHIQHDNKYVLY